MLPRWTAFLAAVAGLNAVYCCNPEQLLYNNLCYQTFDIPKNYDFASIFCKSLEGELADVSEYGENISSILNRWNLDLQTSFYVRDSKTKSNFSSCPIIKTSEVHFVDCETEHPFVCQFPNEARSVYCKEGSHRYKDTCYTSLPVAASYNEAVTLCLLQYGKLAVLSESERQLFVRSLRLTASTYWAGVGKVNGTFRWTDGEELNIPCETCRNSSKDMECVWFKPDPWSWSAAGCSGRAHALCESAGDVRTTVAPSTTEAVLSCPHGYHWKLHEDSGWCFWETTYETEKASWYGAREFCTRYGGDLASYRDRPQEVLGIGGASAHTKGLWIGLKRSMFDDVFRWSDGTDSNYTNWDRLRGEPIRSNTKFCVMHGENDSKWRMDYCGVRRWFVCKAPRVSRPLSPDPPADTRKQCIFPTDPMQRVWTLHGDHCYIILKSSFSWHTARRFCEDNEAHLTSIHSFSETDFLLSLGTGRADVNYWIGGSALNIDDSLSWSDGTAVGFVYWSEDQGLSSLHRPPYCLSFNDRDGSWRKEHCSLLQGVICERPLNDSYEFTSPPPTPVLPGFCPNGTYTFGNKCYKLFLTNTEEKVYPRKLYFNEAKVSCLANGTTLLSIHSQEEQDFVSDLILELGFDTWIGLKGSEKGTLFNWLDSTPMDYTNWDQSEPTTSDKSDQLCVSMKYSSDDMGEWQTSACNSNKPYICQMPKNPFLTEPPSDPFLCPGKLGWVKIGTSCFGVFDDDDEPATWLQAQARCRQQNANLISIENFGVTLFLKRRLTEKTDVYWTGMREMSQNKYQALNGQPLTYSNWLKEQPRRVSEQRNCVAVDTQGKWMVRHCDERHPFVCHQTSEVERETVDSKDLNCPKHSDKWRDLGGNQCFLVSQLNRTAWHRALDYCYRQGGFLASFHSKEDVLEILKYLAPNSDSLYHIGLGRLADGSYRWVDHSPVDYTNWDLDEPSSSSSNCVVMMQTTGKWRIHYCSTATDFICSAPKVSTTHDDAEDSEIPQAVNSSATNENIRNRLEVGGILGIVICFTVLLAIVGVGGYYLCPSTRMKIRLEESESS